MEFCSFICGIIETCPATEIPLMTLELDNQWKFDSAIVSHPQYLRRLPLACTFYCTFRFLRLQKKDIFAQKIREICYVKLPTVTQSVILWLQQGWRKIHVHTEAFPLTAPLNDFRLLQNILFCIPLLNPLQSFYCLSVQFNCTFSVQLYCFPFPNIHKMNGWRIFH